MIDEVLIDITENCPHRCFHCSNIGIGLGPGHLPRRIILSTIRSLPLLRVKVLCFSGGEPLLHPSLLEFIGLATDLGIRTVLYTSGVISDGHGKLSPLDAKLARKMELYGLKDIFLSLHSVDAQAHDNITRCKGSFQILLESIMATRETSVGLRAHFVPMKLNYRDLDLTVRFCIENAFKELRILRLVSQGEGATNFQHIGIEEEELNEFLRLLNYVIEMYANRIAITASGFLELGGCRHNGETATFCRGAMKYMYINSRGDVFPCPAFKCKNEFRIGNLFNGGFLTICNDRIKMERIRRLLSGGRCPAQVSDKSRF